MDAIKFCIEIREEKNFENPVRRWAFAYEFTWEEYINRFKKQEPPVRDMCYSDGHYLELMKRWEIKDKERRDAINMLSKNIAFALNEKL